MFRFYIPSNNFATGTSLAKFLFVILLVLSPRISQTIYFSKTKENKSSGRESLQEVAICFLNEVLVRLINVSKGSLSSQGCHLVTMRIMQSYWCCLRIFLCLIVCALLGDSRVPVPAWCTRLGVIEFNGEWWTLELCWRAHYAHRRCFNWSEGGMSMSVCNPRDKIKLVKRIAKLSTVIFVYGAIRVDLNDGLCRFKVFVIWSISSFFTQAYYLIINAHVCASPCSHTTTGQH